VAPKLKNVFDQVNKEIVAGLQNDGRTTVTQMGEDLGISHVAVQKRLRKLLDKEFIKISADVNIEALDAKIGVLLLEVKRTQDITNLVSLFRDCPRTIFLSGLSSSNLLAIMAAENLSTLHSVIGTCSPRVKNCIRRSQVYIASPQIYPRFLPIKVTARKKASIAPCGERCDRCEEFKKKECRGCPATKFYAGPL
jgi:DNA-binding Lrp family transcriptional regulator